MTALTLPKPVNELRRAREALRQHWVKSALAAQTQWSPDVVDVRSVDVDQVVQFAIDVQQIVKFAQQFKRAPSDLSYQVVFAAKIVDQLERLAAVHFSS